MLRQRQLFWQPCHSAASLASCSLASCTIETATAAASVGLHACLAAPALFVCLRPAGQIGSSTQMLLLFTYMLLFFAHRVSSCWIACTSRACVCARTGTWASTLTQLTTPTQTSARQRVRRTPLIMQHMLHKRPTRLQQHTPHPAMQDMQQLAMRPSTRSPHHRRHSSSSHQ